MPFRCRCVKRSLLLYVVLTESKLQKIEEFVSGRGARSDVVSLPPFGENLGGSLASGSKVTVLSKWSCAALRREHEEAMVQSFRRSQNLVNVVAGDQNVGKTPCPEEAAQASAQTLRNSVDDASTLKPSCKRGSPGLQEAEDEESRQMKGIAWVWMKADRWASCRGTRLNE